MISNLTRLVWFIGKIIFCPTSALDEDLYSLPQRCIKFFKNDENN